MLVIPAMCESSFFDIDAILAEGEKVQGEVLFDCYNLDSLDTGSIKVVPEGDLQPDPQFNVPLTRADEALQDFKKNLGIQNEGLGKRNIVSKTNDLSKGTKISIPFWLASELIIHGLMTCEIPIWYTDNFKKIVLAEPEVMDLQLKSKYYYEFGCMLANLWKQKNFRGNFSFISQVFFERMKIMINLMLHLRDGDDHQFLHRLTDSESSCYNRGRESIIMYGHTGQTRKILIRQRSMMNNRKKLKEA